MKSKSLYYKLIRLLIISLVASVILFFVLVFSLEELYAYLYENNMLYTEKTEHLEENLQKYIEENEVSILETDKIMEWTQSHDVDNLQIFFGDELYFDSSYPEKTRWNHNPEIGYYDWIKPVPISFTDVNVSVSIYCKQSDRVIDAVYILSMFLSFILFVFIFILGIRKEIRYILLLNDQVEQMEAGNFEDEVTIRGDDEVAYLAQSLNKMRQALKDEKEEKEKIEQESKEKITVLSHELRTPLTAILLWITVLKKDTFENEEDRLEVLEGIEENGDKIRELADALIQEVLIK